MGLERRSDGIALVSAAGGEPTGFDTVIWAVGRAPNTEGVGLAEAGIEVAPKGLIPTDAYQATNAPGIYAIGDVTGREPLTPVA